MEEIKPTEKLYRIITWLTIFLSFGLLVVVGYWHLYPYNPLVLSNIQIDRTEVNRGEHLRISVDYCKNTDKSATLYISFIDGVIYNTPNQVLNLDRGCHHTTLSVYIPKALPVGDFVLKGVFKYELNPIRKIEVNGMTKKFTIIK